jgi:hypothetical protein
MNPMPCNFFQFAENNEQAGLKTPFGTPHLEGPKAELLHQPQNRTQTVFFRANR